MAPKKARKKKVAAKRQAWNKGLEIGKKDAFTPSERRHTSIDANPGGGVMRPFRGSKYYRDLAEECRTVAEVGPSQWKASYLRL